MLKVRASVAHMVSTDVMFLDDDHTHQDTPLSEEQWNDYTSQPCEVSHVLFMCLLVIASNHSTYTQCLGLFCQLGIYMYISIVMYVYSTISDGNYFYIVTSDSLVGILNLLCLMQALPYMAIAYSPISYCVPTLSLLFSFSEAEE